MRNKLNSILIGLFLTIGFSWSVENSQFAPHQLPPGNLEINNTPQFIILSFDDNNDPNIVRWIMDSISKFQNPVGLGNSSTFDGQKVPAAWFNISSIHTSAQAKDNMLHGASLGHEMANHTHSHNESFVGFNMTQAQWENELLPGMALLKLDPPNGVGLNKESIGGFRAPRLETNDSMYQVLSNYEFDYDTSLEDGFQDSVDGTNFNWPYKLDNAGGEGWDELIDISIEIGDANRYREPLSKYPDLWEIPIYPFMVPDSLDEIMAQRKSWHELGSKKITGFDYNVFNLFGLNGSDMGKMLKYSLDLRLTGNRAPLMVGYHSRNFGPFSSKNAGIFDLIEYGLQHPEVRFVTGMQLIKWLENPIGLDGLPGQTISIDQQKAFPGLEMTIASSQLIFNQQLPSGSQIEFMNVQGQLNFSEKIVLPLNTVNLPEIAAGSYRIILTDGDTGLRKVFVQNIR